MRFYTKSHQYYCGIDLHTKTMYVCILDAQANVLIHKNIPTQANAFLKTIQPYRLTGTTWWSVWNACCLVLAGRFVRPRRH